MMNFYETEHKFREKLMIFVPIFELVTT
jgi:hypothetical protein